jgi:hypothetical protein
MTDELYVMFSGGYLEEYPSDALQGLLDREGRLVGLRTFHDSLTPRVSEKRGTLKDERETRDRLAGIQASLW